MATLSPPSETFHSPAQEVPDVDCAVCHEPASTQAYVVALKRPLVTRKWYFCSLAHLRVWAAPVR